MFWIVVVLVLAGGALVLWVISSEFSGGGSPPSRQPTKPNPQRGAGDAPATATLPHRRDQPAFNDFDNGLKAESSFAQTNVYIVSAIAEQVYEGPMRGRGFDLWEFEDYADLVCSLLSDLREQDPVHVDGQVDEWVQLVRQTASRNGLGTSQAFREKWELGRSPTVAAERRDSFALIKLRYLDSDRTDADADDIKQNLSSLLAFGRGGVPPEQREGVIPPQIWEDMTGLGPVGLYDRIEDIALAVGEHGLGPKSPLFLTEILGMCWGMREEAGRDTVDDHRDRVLAAMPSQPSDELSHGKYFFEACQSAESTDSADPLRRRTEFRRGRASAVYHVVRSPGDRVNG